MSTGFGDRLAQAVRRAGNPVVVGLDPRIDQLPKAILGERVLADPREACEAIRSFCLEVLAVVAELVPAVKIQCAFFERWGPHGMAALDQVITAAKNRGLLVLIDGKRGDIGPTAAAYAEGYLGSGGLSIWGGDALTVHPYLGGDTLEPFVDVAQARNAGVFVLVKTSNPGSTMFQDLICEGLPLYRHVAAWVQSRAEATRGESGYGIVGAVVGATYPQQLAELRQAMPNAWILIPGYGAQGATAKDVAAGFAEDGLGALVNNSRGIIFAYKSSRYEDFEAFGRWQDAVRQATLGMIQELRTHTPAGKLRAGSSP